MDVFISRKRQLEEIEEDEACRYFWRQHDRDARVRKEQGRPPQQAQRNDPSRPKDLAIPQDLLDFVPAGSSSNHGLTSPSKQDEAYCKHEHVPLNKSPMLSPFISEPLPSSKSFSDRRPSGLKATKIPKSLRTAVPSSEKPFTNVTTPVVSDRKNGFTTSISTFAPSDTTQPGSTVQPSRTAQSGNCMTPREWIIPGWYTEASRKPGVNREALVRLSAINEHTQRYRDAIDEESREKARDLIRDDLHVYEHMLVDESLIKTAKLLDKQHGLPALLAFQEPDIRADAWALASKWRRHDFTPDIMRGILDGKKEGKGGKSRFVARLDPDFEHRLRADFFGEGDLANGQWWPTRFGAIRDGAHGTPQSGIYGEKGKGAYSIVVSGSSYQDKDEGDRILYCGTEGASNKPTDDTKLLIDSLRRMDNDGEKRPVRVIRTQHLPKDNQWRPVRGIRYDGLYIVEADEILDKDKAHHRFTLMRVPDQDPIRFEGHGARPTKQDIEEYDKHQSMNRKMEV